ncbi:MAG TPA: YdcF family protein [Patescibacteria group bacterium]|nr:YdcF family protein [Patescibacteria group bacterium]
MKNKIVILLGIIGILDTIIVSIFIDGVNTGVMVPGIVGLIVVFIFLNREYRWFDLTIRSRWIKGILKLTMISLIITFVLIESIIIFSVKSEANAEVDYLMILGAGLRGEEISLALRERMEKGVVYLNSNPDAVVIVSGGQGTGEKITEAEAMKKYLLDQGVSEARIIKEETSTSTMENFKNTREILLQDNIENPRILIVTNDFHMFRSKLLARRNGFIPYGLPSTTPISILPNCYIREYFAVVKSLIFDR